jgi:signal transduction histidine kinase
LRRRLPLLPLAPLLVIVIGIAAAVTTTLLGVRQIRRTSDDEAQYRATAVAAAMAARLRVTSLEDRGPLLAQAARGTGTEMLLVQQDGATIDNGSLDEFDRDAVVRMLVAEKGVAETASGRQRFATHPLGPPLEHLSVITMVSAPEDPPETLALARAVAAVTLLLVGVAAAVTLSYARAAHDEVDLARARIEAMAEPDADPAGRPMPIRGFDEVGVVTVAFNTLVERFAAAEKSYRADLADAARIDHQRLEFLAGLSHELRTPLNAILGFSHVLESEVDGPLPADARESVEIIRSSGEHLRTLIDDILDLSALESGELKLSKRALDLRRASEEVVREARALAKHKGLAVEVVGSGPPVLANADRRRVRQILTNLVANAVKFTRAGSVRVSVTEEGDRAVVRVVDTGPGIRESEREAIFEAYRQSADTKSRYGGAGLGLATVKRLVLLHGGDISVSSTMGVGSTFTVSLPLASPGDGQLDDGTRPSVPSIAPEAPSSRPRPA